MKETPGILLRYADQGALEIVKYALQKANPNIEINAVNELNSVFIPENYIKPVIDTLTQEGHSTEYGAE